MPGETVTSALATAGAEAPDDRQCSDCYKVIADDEPSGKCASCRDYDRHLEGDQLTKRLSISELVPVYQQAESDIREAFAMIARAERSLNAAFTLDDVRGLAVRTRHNRSLDFRDPDEPLTELRRSVWSTLVERLELRRFMSIKAWKDLSEQLDGREVPEITQETVSAMAEQFNARIPEMLEAAVVEVFDWLRPPRSHYKTNTELEIGKRACLSGVIDTFMFPRLQVGYHYEQHITALENVFTALDGKGSVTKNYSSKLSQAIRAAGFPCSGETEYFKFRAFKNRALHLEFRRLDLLQRFNAIAGGKRLRPVKEKKPAPLRGEPAART